MSTEPSVAVAEDRVAIEVADHVATVRMSRGEKHNALDGGMFASLMAATERLRDEPGVRAVVLCGEGPSFCSGLDVASFAGGADNSLGPDGLLGREDGHLGNVAQRVSIDWAAVPVPVIAAIHGNCFGGGLQIALGADIRIAAPDATLSVMEVRWGLVPDMGITQTLPRLVPMDVAKELTFTGRRFSGEEAAELGVVTRVDADPHAAAQALAAEIATKSPDAVRSAKRLYQETWYAPPAEALALETELQLKLIGSENQIAAVTAGMSGETPQFKDPA